MQHASMTLTDAVKSVMSDIISLSGSEGGIDLVPDSCSSKRLNIIYIINTLTTTNYWGQIGAIIEV